METKPVPGPIFHEENKQLMSRISILSACFFILGAFSALAQPGGNLPAEQVEVIKAFDAKLTESTKVNLVPTLPGVDTSSKTFNYEVLPKPITVDYPPPRIRPVSYRTGEEQNGAAYNAFVKLGGGLPSAIYGEGAYNTFVKKSDKEAYNLGLNLLHHSADFSSGSIENQKFGLTKASGDGTYYLQNGAAVNAQVGYQANRVHYYGYSADPFNTETKVPADAVKQLFNTFELGTRLFNGVKTAGDLNYLAAVNLYRHTDEFASKETGLRMDLGGTKWVAGKHSIDIGVYADFTWYRDTQEVSQTLHNFGLLPAFTYHGRVYKIKLGGKILSSNDEFELFPDVELVLNLTGNELALFAGVSGDLQKNTFRSLSDYNPYIHTRFQNMGIRNTRYLKGFVGVRGNLKVFEYTFEASFKPTNDLPLYKFRFDNDLIYDFDVVYDDVDVVNLSGSLRANPMRGLDITATISQNFYDTKFETKPWHLPSLDLNFMAQYTSPNGKLKGRGQIYMQNGVPANTSFIPGKFETLNSLFDLSLAGEYWFAEKVGAFLELNNLLDNKRQRWRYYPTYGINFLGGITMRF